MTLLIICTITTFILGCVLTKKIGLAYYAHKFKKLIIICDRYEKLNEQLIDNLDNNQKSIHHSENVRTYEAMLRGIKYAAASSIMEEA